MICLPEEPELVRFGEDHKGLSPTNCSIFNGTGNFEGRELQKRPYIFNNDNGTRIKLLMTNHCQTCLLNFLLRLLPQPLQPPQLLLRYPLQEIL